MLVAEAQIVIDGGDYDATMWDVRRDLEPLVANRGGCSGVEACVRAVRMEVKRRGADLIKFRQSSWPAEKI